LEFRQAKKKHKEAKRAAKTLRKAVKSLKCDLAAAAVKNVRPQLSKAKASPRRKGTTVAAAIAAAPNIEVAPVPAENPPGPANGMS
jgi:ferric-dicitrate binding protein FerR (iron transport regulator)